MLKSLKLICVSLLVSCSAQMLKKSPELAKNERFYWLDQNKAGVIYARDCRNRVGDRRDCKEKPIYDLIKEWQYFSNGFVLVPYKMIFPVSLGN